MLIQCIFYLLLKHEHLHWKIFFRVIFSLLFKYTNNVYLMKSNKFLYEQWKKTILQLAGKFFYYNIRSSFSVRKTGNCLFYSLSTRKISKVGTLPSWRSVEGSGWTLCLVSAVRNDKKFTLSDKHLWNNKILLFSH